VKQDLAELVRRKPGHSVFSCFPDSTDNNL
jgi:hypothetical protein